MFSGTAGKPCINQYLAALVYLPRKHVLWLITRLPRPYSWPKTCFLSEKISICLLNLFAGNTSEHIGCCWTLIQLCPQVIYFHYSQNVSTWTNKTELILSVEGGHDGACWILTNELSSKIIMHLETDKLCPFNGTNDLIKLIALPHQPCKWCWVQIPMIKVIWKDLFQTHRRLPAGDMELWDTLAFSPLISKSNY